MFRSFLILIGLALMIGGLYSCDCGGDDGGGRQDIDDDSDVILPQDDDDDDVHWNDDDAGDDDGDDASDDDDDDDDEPDRLEIDPADPGFYTYATQTMSFPDPVSGADKSVDVYYPTADNESIDDRYGTRPVVIFHIEENLPETGYESYVAHFASWGYITILRDNWSTAQTDLAESTTGIIDWLEAQAADSESLFHQKIRFSKLAVVGHGLGGKIAMMAALNDGRVSAAAAVDPNDEGSGSTNNPSLAPERMPLLDKPTCFIGAEAGTDCVDFDENYRQFFNAANSPSSLAEVKDAGHNIFLDDPYCLPCSFCDAGDAGQGLAQLLARRYLTAFFNIYLLDWTEYDYYLTGGRAQYDESDGKIDLDVK